MKSNGMKNFALLGVTFLGIVSLSGCGHYTTQRTSNLLTYLNPEVELKELQTQNRGGQCGRPLASMLGRA